MLLPVHKVRDRASRNRVQQLRDELPSPDRLGQGLVVLFANVQKFPKRGIAEISIDDQHLFLTFGDGIGQIQQAVALALVGQDTGDGQRLCAPLLHAGGDAVGDELIGFLVQEIVGSSGCQNPALFPVSLEVGNFSDHAGIHLLAHIGIVLHGIPQHREQYHHTAVQPRQQQGPKGDLCRQLIRERGRFRDLRCLQRHHVQVRGEVAHQRRIMDQSGFQRQKGQPGRCRRGFHADEVGIGDIAGAQLVVCAAQVLHHHGFQRFGAQHADYGGRDLFGVLYVGNGRAAVAQHRVHGGGGVGVARQKDRRNHPQHGPRKGHQQNVPPVALEVQQHAERVNGPRIVLIDFVVHASAPRQSRTLTNK